MFSSVAAISISCPSVTAFAGIVTSAPSLYTSYPALSSKINDTLFRVLPPSVAPESVYSGSPLENTISSDSVTFPKLSSKRTV